LRQRRVRVYVASAVGIAALVALILGLSGALGGPEDQIVALEGTEIETSASGEAALRPTGSGWWIRLEVAGLPAADPGTYYEGWMWNDQGEGVSIGTFHLRGGEEPVILWSGVDPAEYPAIWVTREPEDGDPGASDQVVMRGRIDG
ncbi:MAG TPA: anti-sigma factor, partial [Acidimicrobiia bacterium]